MEDGTIGINCRRITVLGDGKQQSQVHFIKENNSAKCYFKYGQGTKCHYHLESRRHIKGKEIY